MSMKISQLAGRIQQLTRLARQTTMFEDNSQQINQMTAQVKTGLQGLVRTSDTLRTISNLSNVTRQKSVCFRKSRHEAGACASTMRRLNHIVLFRTRSYKSYKQCRDTPLQRAKAGATPHELLTI
jgi:ABC-type transporter Mla subunit MlaD